MAKITLGHQTCMQCTAGSGDNGLVIGSGLSSSEDWRWFNFDDFEFPSGLRKAIKKIKYVQ